jgi:cytochrome b561
MPDSLRAERYGSTAITLHWLIAVAVLAQIGFGFLLDDLAPRGTPARAEVINLHKSLGLVLALLIVLRLAWRLGHRPPPWPAAMPARRQRLAQWGHRLLYAVLLVTPLAGYTASNFSKYGVKLFGHPLAPWGPESKAVYALFNNLHVASAWLLCALIAGHVLVAFKHLWVDRDGVFARMWPGASS